MHFHHPYVFRQAAVGAVEQTGPGKLLRQLQVGSLTAGVNTGIGPTGADDSDLHGEQIREGLLYSLLHRERVVLPLPAGVAGAAIGEDQSIDHREEGERKSRRKGVQIKR